MSWLIRGNEVIFSGDEGKAQYADCWRIASATGLAMQLPPRAIGDKRQNFFYGGFCFVYEPMQ